MHVFACEAATGKLLLHLIWGSFAILCVIGVFMLAVPKKASSLQVLTDRLAEARKNTDKLFECVRVDSLYERPIPERHRIAFYIGHLEAFDLNLFRSQVPALRPFAPEFDRLFAFGIDPVNGGLPTDRPEDWPHLAQIDGYKKEVRHLLDGAMQAGDFPSRDASIKHSAETLLNVAIEHRLMHAETLAYMFHQLAFERKHPQSQASPNEAAFMAEMLRIPAGSASLGLEPGDAELFGWDNEFNAFETEVPAFRIDKYMVTNGEFLNFLRSGGYENRQFWPHENWRWRQERNIQHPVFWIRADGDWRYRGMFEELPLPLDWPVYVSWAEASAYAKWAHKSLPSEAQWHRAAYGTPQGSERAYPWGNDVPRPSLGNFDFSRWDPAPVTSFPLNKSAFGVQGQLGNGWEWTESLFEPFAGFEPFPFYPGYSADFFDGKHYVMKGGSARTAAPILRRSF
ncbi:MAG: SUMF1/EgtB/PvdO family nonheme iron enzyme, partial [Candidatus Acidiferrum sp.]